MYINTLYWSSVLALVFAPATFAAEPTDVTLPQAKQIVFGPASTATSHPLAPAVQATPIVFQADKQAAEDSPAKDSEKSDNDNEQGSDKSGTSAISKHLNSLTRSVASIRLDQAYFEGKSPDNKAATQSTTSDIFVTSAHHSGRLTNRYPHCFYHNPLYFEELNLERCGNTCGCATTLISGMHFLSSAIVLPYNMATKPPCCCEKTTGDCRCCGEMPCLRPLECNLRGLTAEGVAAAGFVFLLL